SSSSDAASSHVTPAFCGADVRDMMRPPLRLLSTNHPPELHPLARDAPAHRAVLLVDVIGILEACLAGLLHAVVLERLAALVLLPRSLERHRPGVVLGVGERHLDVDAPIGGWREALHRMQ